MSAWRDHASELESKGASLIGISVDSWFAHKVFAEQLNLPAHFHLLSDFPNHAAGKSYGCWNADVGADDRLTVVVDPEGEVVYQTFNSENLVRDPKEALAAIP